MKLDFVVNQNFTDQICFYNSLANVRKLRVHILQLSLWQGKLRIMH